ncbi:hypothetical protein [Roseobacter sp. HKCCD7870]|uniref:hypothetical protein n=1 Tax=Roseobacter sp. HKCCD7870 TaxID=3120343 RepID=UPI0030ED4485
MIEKASFSAHSYKNLLSALAEARFVSVGYEDAEPKKRHMILRHDLDMSLDAALVMADIEAELGMRANYFVLLRTEMYNPWSKAGRSAIRQLREMGHEIGLHFDASLYPSGNGLIDAAVAEECEALEALVGAPVTTVSFHRPVKLLQGYPHKLGGRIHAYQPRFFYEMGYCSDSRGAWFHGHPLDHPAVVEGRAIQLLTHPIWWARSTPLEPVDALDRFRIERDQILARSLAENCDPYRDAYGDDPAGPSN